LDVMFVGSVSFKLIENIEKQGHTVKYKSIDVVYIESIKLS
jgi:hypothetical protein